MNAPVKAVLASSAPRRRGARTKARGSAKSCVFRRIDMPCPLFQYLFTVLRANPRLRGQPRRRKARLPAPAKLPRLWFRGHSTGGDCKAQVLQEAQRISAHASTQNLQLNLPFAA
jgi:hypothetical protein